MNQTLEIAVPTPSVAATRPRILDWLTLTKPRITFMVLVTTLAGFYIAGHGFYRPALLIHTLIGTALAAAGASALNMLLEREHDAKMRRTASRPLPAGRVTPGEALAIGAVCSAAGVLWLLFFVNMISSALASFTILSYLFAYTPLKRVTSLSTVVGAIPGAIPPVIGWAATDRLLGVEAAVLFAILFFWQLPHFLAIAWIYREDYARGGFPVMPVVDPEGASTGRQVVCQTIALTAFSLAPAAVGMAGSSYVMGALALGAAFLLFGIVFAAARTEGRARRLFLASVVYLPVLLALLALTRT